MLARRLSCHVSVHADRLSLPLPSPLLQVLTHLLSVCGEHRGSLGIVTPYIAQLNLLSQQLAGLTAAAAPAAAAHGSARASSSSSRQGQQQQGAAGAAAAEWSPAAAAAGDVLEIKTVDGYQGREKEVVLFSAVRANTQAQVGFLEDWRRLNVAITRPRRGLVIFGHAATLSAGDATWSKYIGWLRQRGCVVAAGQLRQQLAAVQQSSSSRQTLQRLPRLSSA
ncbi:AAA domain-containing protein [Scenedesmus sp. NREL 46B-D3]|nr:AAA domain-containing protein [Scenedesmus sp. NREL 46B-D3]